MSRTPTPSRSASADRYARRFRKLTQQLQALDYFCKGTVLQRRMKCGQPGCACHRDPSKRHGPYWEWTSKARGKTVHIALRPEAGPIYKRASRQYRKLKSLLNRLERLSRAALVALTNNANRTARPQSSKPMRPR
jgi:hypothetical protein